MTMEHIGLRTREWHREADRGANAFAGPDENRILASEIRREASVLVDGERANEIRRRFALEHLKVESVQVHRMRHAGVVIAEQPDFSRVARDFDWRLAHHEDAVVDAPAALVVAEAKRALAGVGDVEWRERRQCRRKRAIVGDAGAD